MGHIKLDKETRAQATPTEWLGVGRQIGELANKWSERDDLVGYVGTNAGHGAPACYNPDLAEIEVDTDIAFGKMVTPEMIGDLTERAQQYEFPKATGAILHEAFHAKYSEWNIPDAQKALKPNEFTALMWLEESRIEAQGMKAMPSARPFLRACAIDIVINDAKEKFAEHSNTMSASFFVATVHSRMDAGILEYEDVSELVELVNDFIGIEVVEKLRAIADEFRAYTMHALADPILYDLAREWAKIVQEVAEEKGEAQSNSGEGSESGEGAEGAGEGSGSTPDFVKEMMEALEEAREAVGIGVMGDLADQEQQEDWEEQVKQKHDEQKENHEHRETAQKVFSKGTTERGGRSSSYLVNTRKPEPSERSAAVQVAKMLERAKYRDRDMTEVNSATPPGRLRTRAMVQGRALKERGVVTQVEPWRKTMRKQTDEPTLTVGVMVDISGSMGGAMEPMATTAWVMSEAVKRVQGKSAMVYYGNDVFATLKPNQHLTDVSVWAATDGTEKFEKAFQALDGGLNLLHGRGARLLVVVSDGHYTHDESRNARKWMHRCAEAGVGVLWLPFDDGHFIKRYGDNVVVVPNTMKPADASVEIGKAAARALEGASKVA